MDGQTLDNYGFPSGFLVSVSVRTEELYREFINLSVSVRYVNGLEKEPVRKTLAKSNFYVSRKRITEAIKVRYGNCSYFDYFIV